jgi:hypothetical protein
MVTEHTDVSRIHLAQGRFRGRAAACTDLCAEDANIGINCRDVSIKRQENMAQWDWPRVKYEKMAQ